MKHTYQPSRYYNAFGPYEPVLHIAAGDTLVSHSLCARGLDAAGNKVAPRGNPLTGPFFIEDAEPGDTLVVRLDRLWPNREYGWTRTVVAPHVVEAAYVRELPQEGDLARWQLDLGGGTARLIEPQTALGQIELALDPMLGCLGVAPSRKQAISSATSAEHGGNMDYRGLRAGVTIYFPVFEPGALLFFGDGHAVQGDGEIIGTGIEISFDVELTVDVLKGKTIGWPRGESATHIFTIGNARPLDGGVQHATTEMMRWLREEYGLDAYGASILLGQCVEYEVGNVFDPAFTMVCKVSKEVLDKIAPA
ncbi:MAG: acetamidase/formamidase family protein [Anaerolineae bacterium]|nr:acetamidase/formamidase family protein [Anaerolineae bacterium]